jgi:hypothetical protein
MGRVADASHFDAAPRGYTVAAPTRVTK